MTGGHSRRGEDDRDGGPGAPNRPATGSRRHGRHDVGAPPRVVASIRPASQGPTSRTNESTSLRCLVLDERWPLCKSTRERSRGGVVGVRLIGGDLDWLANAEGGQHRRRALFGLGNAGDDPGAGVAGAGDMHPGCAGQRGVQPVESACGNARDQRCTWACCGAAAIPILSASSARTRVIRVSSSRPAQLVPRTSDGRAQRHRCACRVRPLRGQPAAADEQLALRAVVPGSRWRPGGVSCRKPGGRSLRISADCSRTAVRQRRPDLAGSTCAASPPTRSPTWPRPPRSPPTPRHSPGAPRLPAGSPDPAALAGTCVTCWTWLHPHGLESLDTPGRFTLGFPHSVDSPSLANPLRRLPLFSRVGGNLEQRADVGSRVAWRHAARDVSGGGLIGGL